MLRVPSARGGVAACSRPQRWERKRHAAARAAPVAAHHVLDAMHIWFIEKKGLQAPRVEARMIADKHFGDVPGCVAVSDIEAGQAICQIPQDAAVTATDAAKHPLVGPVSTGRGDITGLVLWLIAERSPAATGEYGPFVAALPTSTLSPILWDDKFRSTELRGSHVLQEARDREDALRSEWASVAEAIAQLPDRSGFDESCFNEAAFLGAACVALAHAIYLPSAQCFALLPFVSMMQRTGNGDGCDVDYSAETESVVVTSQRQFAAGSNVKLNDPRPNGERLLATGSVQPDNASNYLLFKAELVTSDRMYTGKRDVLQSMGIQDTEYFPLYIDRFPIQLLSFLRLSRIQDSAQLAMASFEQGRIVSQMNEYEVLQLVMGDMRERLAAFLDNQEEDVKALQNPELTPRERLAIMQRCSEKDILQSTTDAIRARLAPIRGIPTKSGKLEDPNQDLLDIFETIEGVGAAPKKIWSSFSRWASGKDDPDWKR